MTEFEKDLILSAIFWPVVLGIFFWYARRKKHPKRTSLNAFLVFIGIFIGLGLLPLFVVTGIVANLLGKASGPLFAVLAFVALAFVPYMWRLARSTIQKDPALPRSWPV